MKNWDMKKVVLYLLATMLIAYGIGGAILFSSPKNAFTGEKADYEINDEKTSKLDGIKNINISVSSPSINIIPVDGTEIKAHLYGKVVAAGISSNTKPKLDYYTSGETLYINVDNKPHISLGFFSSSVKLDVYIPTAYSNDLRVSSSSGGITIRDLKLNKLDCSSSSGSSNLESITANDFSCKSSSGSIKADKLNTKTTKLSSSSGSKRITGFTGDLKASSSSGSTNIEYSTFDNSVDVSASSGSVEITLPENAAFYLDARASSGSVKSDFPITVVGASERNSLKGTVGSDKNKIKVHTSSGSIRISK